MHNFKDQTWRWSWTCLVNLFMFSSSSSDLTHHPGVQYTARRAHTRPAVHIPKLERTATHLTSQRSVRRPGGEKARARPPELPTMAAASALTASGRALRRGAAARRRRRRRRRRRVPPANSRSCPPRPCRPPPIHSPGCEEPKGPHASPPSLPPPRGCAQTLRSV